MTMFSKARLFLSAGVLAVACSSAVWADSAAVSLTPAAGDVFNNGNGYSLGFEFTLSKAVSVDDLGYFDDGGLTQSHKVGIYTTSGDLLVSATVTTGDPVSNFFAYQSITPYDLAAGTYVIAGVTGTEDPYAFDPSTFSTNSAVTFDTAVYSLSSSLVYPGISQGGVTGYFGPNFEIASAVATPEPGPRWALLAGLVGLAGFSLRKRFERA